MTDREQACLFALLQMIKSGKYSAAGVLRELKREGYTLAEISKATEGMEATQ